MRNEMYLILIPLLATDKIFFSVVINVLSIIPVVIQLYNDIPKEKKE